MKNREKSIFWTSLIITFLAGPLGFIYPAFIVERDMKPVAWKAFWIIIVFSLFWAILLIFIYFWFFTTLLSGLM